MKIMEDMSGIRVWKMKTKILLIGLCFMILFGITYTILSNELIKEWHWMMLIETILSVLIRF